MTDIKLYPYQEVFLQALMKGKNITFDYNRTRRFYKTRHSDFLTTAKMLLMKEDQTLIIDTPNGTVLFKCIENNILNEGK